MGKSYFFGALLALSLVVPSLSFAGCEDGTAMAEDSAVRDLAKVLPSAPRTCKANATSMKDLPNGESHRVTVRCTGRLPALYVVTLREIEDAYCVVKSVKRLK